MDDGDETTRAEQLPEVFEARVAVDPEHERVDSRDLVERQVEGWQCVDRAKAQADHTTSNALGIALGCLIQHELGVIDPADVTLVREAT